MSGIDHLAKRFQASKTEGLSGRVRRRGRNNILRANRDMLIKFRYSKQYDSPVVMSKHKLYIPIASKETKLADTSNNSTDKTVLLKNFIIYFELIPIIS